MVVASNGLLQVPKDDDEDDDDDEDVPGPPALPPPPKVMKRESMVPPPSKEERCPWNKMWDENQHAWYYMHDDGVTSTWEEPLGFVE
ncbi:hypothetical protein TrLO_g5151 [Triparma laevis f. longispina]|uniref:WW domain-containing protein n=1 Tax=Triparma laevis f. longispina TaxID=1714387 RepID=A0A9W7FF04_9STRA|nr:hypothetical protein TrLO_g5151 [Triparma laevis f. longispina]